MKNFRIVIMSKFLLLLLVILPGISHAQNNNYDTSRDGFISAIDVLLVINALNRNETDPDQIRTRDVNGDGRLSAIDALIIINYLNAHGSGPVGGSGNSSSNNGNTSGGNSSGGNTSGNGSSSSGGNGSTVKTQEATIDSVIYNSDKSVSLEAYTGDPKTSFISIDEVKSFDENFKIDGKVDSLRTITVKDKGKIGYSYYNKEESLNPITVSELNLDGVWGKKRITDSVKGMFEGRFGMYDVMVQTEDVTIQGVPYSGGISFNNGATGISNNKLTYEAVDANGHLNLSTAREIYAKFYYDHASTVSQDSSSFSFVFTDDKGATHEAAIAVPYDPEYFNKLKNSKAVSPLNKNGTKLLRVKVASLKDKLNIANIAKVEFKINTEQAQDTYVDYIRVAVPTKLSSPEEFGQGEGEGAGSAHSLSANCKYSKLNYLGQSDSISKWEDIFHDFAGGDRAGRVFDFSSSSSIKNQCLKANIDAAAKVCGRNVAEASDIRLSSHHEEWGFMQSPPLPPAAAVAAFCNGLSGEDLNVCTKLRDMFASAKVTAEQIDDYYRLHNSGRTFDELLKSDRTFLEMFLQRESGADDCIFYTLLRSDPSLLYQKEISDIVTAQGFKRLDNSADYVDDKINLGGHASISRVYDENCKALTKAELANIDPANICDDINARAFISPISFRWTDRSYSSEQISITSFPLDNQDGKFYQWRASSDMPLLVHDPKHEGKITSASQLFGGWTFGGKGQSASLAQTSLPKSGKWENGYEALATLDIDNSGAVDNQELQELGLWFDENQNGISEQGEVKTLSELNVTKIFYGPVVNDADGKSVSVKAGFERLFNGKLLKGETIDWYSDSYDSSAEAVLNYEAIRQLSASVPSSLSDISTDTQESSFAKNDSKNPILHGTWKWVAEGMENYSKKSKNIPYSGYFQFHLTEKGVEGLSMVELPVEISTPNVGILPANTIANMMVFKVVPGENSNLGKEFSFESEIKGVKTVSKVLMYKDASSNNEYRLSGSSESSYQNPKTGKIATLKYNWNAEPVAYAK